jgi:RNA polymerase sigma-70 factor (ECF subfamily)
MSDKLQHAPTAPEADPDRVARFRALVDAHTQALYQLALHFAGNGADAEDLVQETFLRAWHGFGNLRPGGHPRAWLFTILRHLYFERYRRERRQPSTIDVGDVDEWYLYTRVHNADAQQETADPEAAFFATLSDEHVAAAVAALPPEFREIFVLVDFEGFSYREVSEITGVPVGTVMSRLYRARHRLQRELWDYCVRTRQCRAGRPAPAQPQTPECREACREIYRYLDGALDPAALAAIDRHLDRCRPCCDRFAFQRRLAAAARRSQHATKVPERLRTRLETIAARFEVRRGDGAAGEAPR